MIPFNSLRMLREGREGATESAVVLTSAPASAGDTPLLKEAPTSSEVPIGTLICGFNYTGSVTGCIDCKPGKFQNVTGGSLCYTCGSGQFTDQVNQGFLSHRKLSFLQTGIFSLTLP